MPEASSAFMFACDTIAAKGGLSGPQARGAIRLALKDAGLDARTVLPREMAVVFEKMMRTRLVAQGIAAEQADKLCREMASTLREMHTEDRGTAAASMFDRLDQTR